MTLNQQTSPVVRLSALAAVIATAAMFGLTYSLSASLIALDLVERGSSEFLIGTNAAMHAVGVLITAMFLPKIVPIFGMKRMVVFALIAAALVLMAFPAAPLLWMWFPLRLALGMASEFLFVLSETWTNSLSTEATRSRAMAAYTASLAIGFALGPIILSLIGDQGFYPYGVGAGIALAAAAFIAVVRIDVPEFERKPSGSLFHFIRLAPVAISATVLNAAIETAGLSFLAVYATNLGWPESSAIRLVSIMMIGAILLQLPIGWLGDKMDRIMLLIGLAVVATAGALLWPVALSSEFATYALLFIWGGAFVGIYTIMLSIAGSRFSGTDLVGIYAAMGLMWGLGALLGPLLAGISMQATLHGLAYFAAAACACFSLFAILKGRGSS